MSMPGRRSAAAVLVLGAVGGCSAADPGPAQLPINVAADADRRIVRIDDAAAVPDVVDAVAALGTDLLQAGPAEGNALVSPVGVAVTLSMLADGAAGQTAAELDAALGAEAASRADAVNALLASLAQHDRGPESLDPEELPETALLHLANGIVVDDDVTVSEDYLIDLREGYDAAVAVTDLASQVGKDELDGWVRYHTGGLVERSAIVPSPDLVAVLQNAVLFAARWSSPFFTTETDTFTLTTGEEVEVAMMRSLAEARFARTGHLTAVRLPYTDGFAMDVALPAPGGGLDATLAALDDAMDDAEPTSVAVAVPRMDIAAHTDLTTALRGAGVERVFTGAAELDGIAPGVRVGQAAHQVRLVVDEEGTLAAAATEMGMAGSAPPEPAEVLVADRPFALRIVDLDTELPVFMGLVRDPRGGHQ